MIFRIIFNYDSENSRKTAPDAFQKVGKCPAHLFYTFQTIGKCPAHLFYAFQKVGKCPAHLFWTFQKVGKSPAHLFYEAVSKRQSLVLYFQAANFRLGMSAW
jgi:hypothetical protein